MRDKLNNNPLVQMGVVGVLLICGAIFILTSMGGGESESGSGGEAAASLSASSAPAGEGPAPSPTATPVASSVPSTPLAARPLPAPVVDAWKRGDTVALLIVHKGGIDDDLVERATSRLGWMPKVVTFVVSADKIARYAAITEAVGVERVPALVVLEPRRLDRSAPAATVSYGFQSDASLVQAIRDAGYKGPTVEYHP